VVKVSEKKMLETFSANILTTVFVDTWLWKTKHSRKRLQKFPSIIRVIDMSDRNPPIAATTVTFYVMLAGCDGWILIRHVDNTYDWRKFWKRFPECFVLQSRVSTKTVVRTKPKMLWRSKQQLPQKNTIFIKLLC